MRGGSVTSLSLFGLLMSSSHIFLHFIYLLGMPISVPKFPLSMMWKVDSLEKTLMLGKIEGRKRRERQRMRWLDGMTNSCHPTHGHEFEQASGVGDGQGSLTCCHPWDCKQLDMTEWLNWLIILLFYISEVQHEPHQAKIKVLAGFGSFLESLEENFLAFFSF